MGLYFDPSAPAPVPQPGGDASQLQFGQLPPIVLPRVGILNPLPESPDLDAVVAWARRAQRILRDANLAG